MLKHKIYFRSKYNMNAISINLNNYNVQDRPTHLGPGTRPLPLGYCHLVCLDWECIWTQLDTPPYRVHATGSKSAHALECMERYGAVPRNPRIPTHAHTAQVGPRK